MDINLSKASLTKKIIMIFFLTIFYAGHIKAEETKEVFVNKFFIDLYLMYKFPIKKNIFLGNLEIEKPNISFSEIDQSLLVNTKFKLVVNQNFSEGFITFKTFPTFNATKQLIVVQKSSIDNFNFSNSTLSKDSLDFLNLILLKSIDGLSIYKIDKSTNSPKEIKIYENGILFRY
jgi:hypothetical protein